MIRNPDGFPPGSLLRISPARKPEWEINELGYGEFNELVRTTRKLLTGARGMYADDLNLPERTTNFSVNVSELDERAGGGEESLRNTSRDFDAQLDKPETADLEVLRELIMRSAAFGLAGAVPLSVAGDLPSDRETLLTQAASIQKELAQRVEELDEHAARFNADMTTAGDNPVPRL